MRAIDYLTGLPWIPHSIERRGRPSGAELRRWCRARSVLINGVFVAELQEIPNGCTIWQLIFFPGNPTRQCHMVQAL